MKKNYFFGAILALSFMGCTSGGDVHPTTTVVVNTAIIDAEAAASAWAAMTVSCPICGVGGWVGLGTAAVATIIGADASGAFGGRYAVPNNDGKNKNINLETYLLVTNNEAEQFGVKHNIALNFINKKQNKLEFIGKLQDYDIDSWIEILSVVEPNLTLTQKKDIVRKAKEVQVVETLNTKRLFNSEASVNFDSFLTISSYSNEVKNELRVIVNTYKNLVENVTSETDELTFLNNEISKRLKVEVAYTTEESTVLVFLSVLKHSTYYWSSSK